MTEEQLRRRITELEAENERLLTELRKAKDTIANAKNIDPVLRPSISRIRRITQNTGIDVIKHHVKGYVVAMGRFKQWFRRLRDIWEIVKRDEWDLCELIPSSVPPSHAQEKSIYKLLTEAKEKPDQHKGESITFGASTRDYNRLVIPPVVRKNRARCDRSKQPVEEYAPPRKPERFPSLVPGRGVYAHARPP